MTSVTLWMWMATTPALANGQHSHLWITQHALTHLEEGPLKDLLSSSEHLNKLKNGSMFPDGGYAVNDPYGESAHWEPIQQAYLDWILDHYGVVDTGEGAEHAAFLLGMASHGMGDQVYDSLFLEVAKQYDVETDWSIYSVDEATDVGLASKVVPLDPPPQWVPTDALTEVFASVQQHEVSGETLLEGQTLLALAVLFVANMGQNPESVALYNERFPWATTHQLDPNTPGTPPCEGAVIALYWETLWAELNGERWEDVLTSVPPSGASGLPTEASRSESRVAVVFARGLSASSVTPDAFEITTETGQALPFDTWLYYGEHSNVVLLIPEQDWPKDTLLDVRVREGLRTWEGHVLEGGDVFSIRTEGADIDPEPALTKEGQSKACGCTLSSPPFVVWPWLCVALFYRRGARRST